MTIMLKQSPFGVIQLSPENYVEASFDTLPIGQWVISSIFSYFRITDKELGLPKVRQVIRVF